MDMIKILRGKLSLQAVPVNRSGIVEAAITLTVYAGEDDRQRALASGYQQHVTTPLEPDQLVAAITIRLRGHRFQS